jgi:hypothetical protein
MRHTIRSSNSKTTATPTCAAYGTRIRHILSFLTNSGPEGRSTQSHTMAALFKHIQADSATQKQIGQARAAAPVTRKPGMTTNKNPRCLTHRQQL